MADIVLILGAGASRSMGTPLMGDFFNIAARLSSHASIKDHYSRVLPVLIELQRAALKSSLAPTNLEEVWVAMELARLAGRLGQLGSEQVELAEQSFLTLIEQVIEQSGKVSLGSTVDNHRVPWPSGFYEKLASVLADRILANSRNGATFPSVAIITFNYDVLLDAALAARYVRYDYGWSHSIASESVPLLKVHGSLNWFALSDADAPTDSVLDFAQAFDASGGFKPIRCRDCFLSSQPSKTDYRTVIVAPSDSKLQGRRRLTTVWKHAAEHLSRARAIVTVGYSLPSSDAFFRPFFGVSTISDSYLERFTVIDPAETTHQRMSALLGEQTRGVIRIVPKLCEKLTDTEVKELLKL